MPTEEEVKSMVQTIAEALSGIVNLSPFDCALGIEIADRQIGQLANVRGMLVDIRDRANKNEGEA